MPPAKLPELDCDDWSLIVIALAQWAGNPNDLETATERHAYCLLERIAAAHGCTPIELLDQYPRSLPHSVEYL